MTANKSLQASTIKSTRTSKFELLRFLGAVMVIVFHVSFVNRNTWFYTNMAILLEVPVLLFIFMSGFFLANTKSSRVLKFLWIILFYYLLNLLVSFIFIKTNLIPPSRGKFEDIVHYGWGPWWYLWTLPFLYLIAPLINIALKNINRWYTLLVALSFYLFYFIGSNISYSPTLVGPGQIILFITVYTFGAWWKINEPLFKNKKILLILAISCLLLIQVINNILFACGLKQLFFIIKDGEKDNTGIFALICALSIFIIFQNIKMKYNKFVNFLGQLSLPIYLFHIVFLIIVQEHILTNFNIGNSLTLSIILIALLTLVFATIFSAIIIIPVNYAINYCDKKLMKFLNLLKIYFVNKVIPYFNNSKFILYLRKDKIAIDEKN